MEAKELRIGNIISASRGSLVRVDEIRLSSDGNYVVRMHEGKTPGVVFTSLPLKDALPVPLTEEWLKRCGFIRLEHEESVLRIGGEKNIGGFELFGRDGFGYKLAEYTDRAGYSGVWSEIKSVHQLQNLYFALTGEELKINLSTPATT